MAEYGREQNSQLMRAIANSETGSKQLKRFVDNRLAQKKINHLQEGIHSHNHTSSKLSLQLKLLNKRITQLMLSSSYTDYDLTMEADDAARVTDRSDSTYHRSPRSDFYPSNFDPGIREKVLEQYKDSKDPKMIKCASCDRYFNESKMTIDHITSVVRHFNSVGYKIGQEARKTWYNDISNLQPMCRSCNSRKGSGGESFDTDKIMMAICK